MKLCSSRNEVPVAPYAVKICCRAPAGSDPGARYIEVTFNDSAPEIDAADAIEGSRTRGIASAQQNRSNDPRSLNLQADRARGAYACPLEFYSSSHMDTA